MSLVPFKTRRAYSPLNRFVEELDGFFESTNSLSAPLDVVSTEHEIVIKVEVPGIPKENIAVDYDDGILTITGSKEDQVDKNDTNRTYSERRYGRFERKLSVGRNVNFKNAVATVDHGVLHVTLPKSDEDKPKSRIPIS